MRSVYFQRISCILTLIGIVFVWLFVNFNLLVIEPGVMHDEALIFDIAKTYETSGKFATQLYGSTFQGLDVYAFWHPPLYYFLLSVWMHFVGGSIEALRTLSLLVATSTLILIFFFIQKYFQTLILSIAAVLYISINPEFGMAARIVRMDVLAIFFIVCAILIHLVSIKKQKHSLFILSGIFSCLAIFTHPFGIIVALTIVLSELTDIQTSFVNRLSNLFHFFIPLPVLIFIWYLIIRERIDLFISQMQFQFSYRTQLQSFFIDIFTSNPFYLLIIGSYVLIIILSIISIKKSHFKRQFLFLTTGFILTILSISIGKLSVYMAYIQPYDTLLSVLLLYRIKDAKSLFIKILYSAPFVTLIFCHFILYFLLFSQGNIYAPPSYHQVTLNLLEKIPEGSTVLLSTIPDFYIDFPKNGRVRFFEYPPYLPQNAQDEEFMNGIDIIIFNTQFPHLLHYIKSNAQRIIVVPFPQGLIGYIGYLRSKEERIKVSR